VNLSTLTNLLRWWQSLEFKTAARKYHRWLMAAVGLQFLLWTLTGVYMVSMNIHYIHGESLIKPKSTALNLSSVNVSMAQLFAQYPNATQLTLTQSMGSPIYIVSTGSSKFIVDGSTGARKPDINEQAAREIAHYHYVKSDAIKNTRLIQSSSEMPAELSSRHLPVWQIVFEGIANPTFYVSQKTGEIVTKRHDYWRLFDWMWRFHIMDYDDGENVANWFLFIVAALGVVAALSGGLLLIVRFGEAHNENFP
jgi:uncharacterized iron-regulated membrane protein